MGQPQGGPWVEETWRGSGKYPWAYLLISLPPPARYITQQGNKLETGKSRVPPTVTNAVSWRSEGIKYKKNEVFIDVIESVNLLVSLHTSAPPSLQPRARRRSPMLVNRLPRHQCLHPQVNANGSVLLSEIVGSIKLKVFLSGMPELRLGLNDRVLFELTGRKFLEGGARGRCCESSRRGQRSVRGRQLSGLREGPPVLNLVLRGAPRGVVGIQRGRR